MRNDKTLQGANFTCFHAGPTEGWTQFHLEPPDVPRPARGKLFLRSLLGAAGVEISLNAVLPGMGIPFLHRHQENDEVYIFVGGRGPVVGACAQDVSAGYVELRGGGDSPIGGHRRSEPDRRPWRIGAHTQVFPRFNLRWVEVHRARTTIVKPREMQAVALADAALSRRIAPDVYRLRRLGCGCG